MDKSELEKYKREMMSMYGRSTSAGEETVPAADESSDDDAEDIVSPEISEVDTDAPDDTAWAPHPEEDREETSDIEDEYNTRYPEPDLSALDESSGSENTTPPEYFSEESIGTSVGYILVYVRTGDESSPVIGATVMVTAVIDGNRAVLASGVTDENGTTRRFELPAPDAEHSQSPGSETRPYSLFDVSVTAEGFFNARSVDVPVFAGITSVQNFSMIPAPIMMSPADETVTYYNQEPRFDNASGREG